MSVPHNAPMIDRAALGAMWRDIRLLARGGSRVLLRIPGDPLSGSSCRIDMRLARKILLGPVAATGAKGVAAIVERNANDPLGVAMARTRRTL